MNKQQFIPKAPPEDKRSPLQPGQTEGEVHVGSVEKPDADAISGVKQPPKQKTTEPTDLKMWIMVGITKDDSYIYKLSPNIDINNVLGLKTYLDMKIDSDIAQLQRFGTGMVQNSLQELVKMQKSYSEVVATRISEVTQSLNMQAVALKNFLEKIINKESATPATKPKASKKKTKKKTKKRTKK